MKKNKFLFGKRSKKKEWAPGLWDIVGGKSCKDEHPLLTLRREVFEEVGVNVLNAYLLRTLDISDPDLPGGITYHIYVITAYRGKPFNCSNEHTRIRWLTREKLARRSLALAEYLEMVDIIQKESIPDPDL